MAKCIMVQGTSSNAGKTVIVAALCRIYSRRGYKVAPFKSQNMTLNSYATKENGEIAIAQVLQAEAADIEPSIHMNPILLKPKGNFVSHIIIQGKSIVDMTFYDYQNKFRKTAISAIKESLSILKSEYDIIIIEGAGSPAEINMRKEDVVNMEIAHIANADVILVADIDKGGVFASIAGTFSLLDYHDRSRLKAVIINKFSGNLDILMPGIEKIEKIINAPVLGVLPYDHDLHLPEEDSASFLEHRFDSNKNITIGFIHLPNLLNFTDIEPLEFEEDISLKFIDINENIIDKSGNTIIDVIILPGTRNTIEDMIAIEESGLADQIRKIAKNHQEIPIIGIYGGYQILGKKIYDKNNREFQKGSVNGLGLLDIETHLEHNSSEEKIAVQREGIILEENSSKTDNSNATDIFSSIIGETIKGYEIHEKITTLSKEKPLIKIEKTLGKKKKVNKKDLFDGAKRGNIFGSYFHGIFHNYNFRRALLNYIREKKGLKPQVNKDYYEIKKAYSIDKLAEIVEKNIDMEFIDNLIQL